MTTSDTGTGETFVTMTVYSTVEPGNSGPPPTTAICLVIVSCCAGPTITTVGSGPVAGLQSPSVRTGTGSVVVMRA